MVGPPQGPPAGPPPGPIGPPPGPGPSSGPGATVGLQPVAVGPSSRSAASVIARAIAVVGGAAMIAGSFLPWYKVFVFWHSGVQIGSDGAIVVGCGAVIAAVAIVFRRVWALPATLAVALAAAIAVPETNSILTTRTVIGGDSLTIGVGLVAVDVGLLLCLAAIVVGMVRLRGPR